ncbi:MAG: serine--tRNA ligase, partial [Bacteroidia bacterium]|nr:serine--tRNA ligase [Bacteroidia bacterium]
MLTIAQIREKKDAVISGLKKKKVHDAEQLLNELLELDDNRRQRQKERDDLQACANKASDSIGILMSQGKKEEAEKTRQEVMSLKENVKQKEAEVKGIEDAIKEKLSVIPNAAHALVPEGDDASGNKVVYIYGEKPIFKTYPKPHWDLAKEYQLIDFELGNKVTGAGFPVYTNKGAKLQRALINFFLDEAEKAGYIEIQPPILVNADSGFGTGQLPDKDGQMYYVNLDELYLIPTAEVPITNLYRNNLLKESELPIKNCGYTPCFRREAGSHGKDVRGLNRLHQFDKVEIVQIVHPEKSYEVLEEMREYVAGLLKKLELHFRTVLLCGGDMGFASAMTYDMEVWSGAQERWLEVSSISNFESYQAVRMQCRFKDATGKNRYVHTLNGSALALPRIVACLL